MSVIQSTRCACGQRMQSVPLAYDRNVAFLTRSDSYRVTRWESQFARKMAPPEYPTFFSATATAGEILSFMGALLASYYYWSPWDEAIAKIAVDRGWPAHILWIISSTAAVLYYGGWPFYFCSRWRTWRRSLREYRDIHRAWKESWICLSCGRIATPRRLNQN